MEENVKSATPRRPRAASSVSKAATPPPKEKAAESKAAPAKAKKAGSQPKVAKVKKPKLVRDSFTIPKDEYEVLDQLKQRCAKLSQPSKKSELLRAGLKALAAMADKNLLTALQAVPSIKTGRPKKD